MRQCFAIIAPKQGKEKGQSGKKKSFCHGLPLNLKRMTCFYACKTRRFILQYYQKIGFLPTFAAFSEGRPDYVRAVHQGEPIMSKSDQQYRISEEERKKFLDDIRVGLWRIEIAPGEPARMFGDENMYAILGAAPETGPEELYRHWHSRIEPVYLTYVDNAVNQLITAGTPAEVEYVWNHPQKGRTVVRCDAALSSQQEPGKIGMLGMHRDITDKLTGRSWEDKTHHIVDPYKMSLCSRYLLKTYEDVFFVDRVTGTLHPVAHGHGPALSMEDSWELSGIVDICVPPADREQVHNLFSRETMEAVIRDNGSRSVDFRRRNLQGGYDWVRGTLYPVPINGVDELLFVVQDIQNEQQLKALKAEKEDVLYSIIHPRSAIFEWDRESGQMQVLKHDLQKLSHSLDGRRIPLNVFLDQLCEGYVDDSDREKARGFLTLENMEKCVTERRKRSITLLLDAQQHKYDWIKVFLLPSSLSGNKAYLVLEMMGRKEGLYPILESYIQEMVDHCYCIDLKTDYFFRFVGDENAWEMPPKEGCDYTREMERYADRFVVEAERAQVKRLMHPEAILRALETAPEYSFVESVVGEQGEIRKKRLTYTPFHQSKGYVLLQRVDITELSSREKLLEEARRESVTDSLTQLYNRLGGEQLIRKAMEETKEENHPVMILLDLDNFKEVNDRFGHPVGDRVLREAAQKLRDSFRAGDILYRLGGDEYVAFLKAIAHREDIHPVLARLGKKMRIECEKDGVSLTVTASMGAAFYRGQSFEELYRQADAALYYAKKNKGGYALFEDVE